MDPRPARRPRDVAVVALAGLGAGAALYPSAFLLAQVLARSCRLEGVEGLAGCLLDGLASLILSAVVLTVVAGFALRPAPAFADRIEALLDD